MTVFENKKHFDAFFKYVKYCRKQDVKLDIIDKQKIEVASLTKQDSYFIITPATQTLEQIMKQKNPNMEDKIMLIENIQYAFTTLVKGKFVLGNISPANIEIRPNMANFINASTIVDFDALKPRRELNDDRPTNPVYSDWTKHHDFAFSIEKAIETKCSTASLLTSSRARILGKQMDRSDDLQSLLYVYCWIINDGEIPAERYDFLQQDVYKEPFDLQAYCKVDITEVLSRLIHEIAGKEYASDRKASDIYSKLGLETQDNFSWER